MLPSFIRKPLHVLADIGEAVVEIALSSAGGAFADEAKAMPEQDFSTAVLRLSTEKRSILSRIIRWRTDSPISHAEFWFPKTGWTLGSRFPDGVRWRGPESTAKQSNVMLFTFPRIEEAAKWVAENRVGFRYDTLGIFGIATAKDWHDKNERFCSETVAEGAEHRFPVPELIAAHLRLPLVNSIIPVWQVTPRDLMLSPILETVHYVTAKPSTLTMATTGTYASSPSWKE